MYKAYCDCVTVRTARSSFLAVSDGFVLGFIFGFVLGFIFGFVLGFIFGFVLGFIFGFVLGFIFGFVLGFILASFLASFLSNHLQRSGCRFCTCSAGCLRRDNIVRAVGG